MSAHSQNPVELLRLIREPGNMERTSCVGEERIVVWLTPDYPPEYTTSQEHTRSLPSGTSTDRLAKHRQSSPLLSFVRVLNTQPDFPVAEILRSDWRTGSMRRPNTASAMNLQAMEIYEDWINPLTGEASHLSGPKSARARLSTSCRRTGARRGRRCYLCPDQGPPVTYESMPRARTRRRETAVGVRTRSVESA